MTEQLLLRGIDTLPPFVHAPSQLEGAPVANAHDVAAYILRQHGSMTTMKLQKLIYYAQAWSLVRRDAALFTDEIQAWAAGPVVRSLFESHRGMYTADAATFGGVPTRLTDEEKRTIDKVIKHYGGFSAVQLSDLTHSERPWKEAREGLPPTERGDRVIPLESMFDYYSSLARKA